MRRTTTIALLLFVVTAFSSCSINSKLIKPLKFVENSATTKYWTTVKLSAVWSSERRNINRESVKKFVASHPNNGFGLVTIEYESFHKGFFSTSGDLTMIAPYNLIQADDKDTIIPTNWEKAKEANSLESKYFRAHIGDGVNSGNMISHLPAGQYGLIAFGKSLDGGVIFGDWYVGRITVKPNMLTIIKLRSPARSWDGSRPDDSSIEYSNTMCSETDFVIFLRSDADLPKDKRISTNDTNDKCYRASDILEALVPEVEKWMATTP